MAKFSNKVAVVTGASKGIGAAIAKRLAAEGASVVVNYATSKQDADRVVAQITQAGGRAIAVAAHVGNEDDVARLFAETKKAFGKVDVLVNNAGVYGPTPIEALSASEFHRHFDTNVLGPLLVTKAAIPLFPAEGGSIVNIGSIVSTLALPGVAVYASTKGAIDTIVKTLAKELAPRRIRVNGVSPGYTHTEGVAAAGMKGNEFEAQMLAMTPLGCAGKPEDIAASVAFLASDEASFITGEILAVSGGNGM
jgi:3-oxoacyl-[acyl-carrier protein] reductase